MYCRLDKVEIMPTPHERKADSKILKILTEVHGERKESLYETRDRVYAIAKEYGIAVKPVYDLYIEAGIAFRHDLYAKAIEKYEAIFDILGSPDSSILYSYCAVHMGSIYAMQGQFYMSQTYFTLAERKLRYLDKDLSLLLNVNISGTYIQLQDYQSAIDHGLRAIELGEKSQSISTYSLAHSNLGLSYARLGQFELALVAIKKALQISSNKYCERSNIYANFYQAIIFSLLGDSENAHKGFEYSVNKLEIYSDAYIKIELFDAYSQFLLEEKQYKKAIVFAELMLETPSSDEDKKVLAGIYQVMVSCYQALGDTAKEIEYLHLTSSTLQLEAEVSRDREANYVEKAVNHARNEQQRSHMNNLQEHLASFSYLGQFIACSTDHSSGLLAIANKLNEIIPLSMLALALYDKDKYELDYRYIVNNDETIEGPILSCHRNDKIGVYCAVEKKSVLLDTGSIDELRSYINVDSDIGATLLGNIDNQIQSVIYVPVILNDELLAVVTVQNEESYCYNDLHLHLVEQLANYIAISIKNQQQNRILEIQKEALNQSHKRLERLYRTDNLTDLLNRHALHEDMQDMSQKLFSSILIDIDDYKSYNDHYGHVKGDEVLVQLSQIFQDECKYQGNAYRIGGDEFLIILSCKTTQCAFDVASSIKAKIQKLKIVHERSSVSDRISCTFGIYTTHKGPLINLERVLHNTDLALYQAKREGRNAIAVYNSETEKSVCI